MILDALRTDGIWYILLSVSGGTCNDLELLGIAHLLAYLLLLPSPNLFIDSIPFPFLSVAHFLLWRGVGEYGMLPVLQRFGGAYEVFFYRVMLCIRGTSNGPVSVSVCLS